MLRNTATPQFSKLYNDFGLTVLPGKGDRRGPIEPFPKSGGKNV